MSGWSLPFPSDGARERRTSAADWMAGIRRVGEITREAAPAAPAHSHLVGGRLVTRITPRALTLLGGTLVALAVASCKKDAPIDASKVFASRTLALAYLQRGQLAEAEAEFKKVIALVPDDRLGYANLGLTYLQAGRFKDAEPALKRAQELDPANTEVGLMLARLYTLTSRPDDARKTLEALRADSSAAVRVLYALADLDRTRTDAASQRQYEARLRAVLAAAPANLAVRLDLVTLLAQRALDDSVLRHLEEVKRIPPSLPADLRAPLDSAIRALQDGRPTDAKAPLDRFLAQVRVSMPYQASLEEVKSGAADSPLIGRAVLTFAPTSLIARMGIRDQATVDSVQFRDVVDEAGLVDGQLKPAAAGAPTEAVTAIAAGDVDGDGVEDLFVAFPAATHERPAHLFRVRGGFARDVSPTAGVELRDGARFARFGDVDNDGWLDLFVIGGDGRGHLFRNRGDTRFEDVTARAGISDVHGARRALFVDLDHDGDLDLLLVGSGPAFVYRNNLDGTFTDATAVYGVSGDAVTGDAAFGDFDGDGRIDLFVASPAGTGRVFRNGGAQRFSDATAASGVTGSGGSAAVAVGDYDNDGALDLFVAGTNGGAPALRRGQDSTFTADRRSSAALQPLGGVDATAAAFVDYDNDGWQDLLVVGTARAAGTPALFLFRNDRRGQFLDRSSLIPAPVRAAGATALVVLDVDADGDQDVLVTDRAGALHLLRNDGGNSNMAVQVTLKGLRAGSGKNNDFGIGARLQLRAGEIYQTRVVTGAATHFGLGPHLKADVLRVEWPNGVPQSLYLPGGDRDVVETELLKGSCAFAYTWDGTQFRFVTDVMWRSALGMPMGLMGTTATFAPAGASQEYLRIPGSALKPRNGKYVMQLTEELWETAYADEIKLIAVDHPDSVDVFVDERFVPPGPVSMRLFQVARPERVVQASDERGVNLLPQLRASDAQYVANFTPTQYQGVVHPHDLVLDLGASAGQPGVHLFLRGWIYPTDASINVALSQQRALTIASPSLEVIDAKGRWVTAIPDIGFPSGKDKTVIVDLAGKFPTADHRVRIRTNMQIYWDEAFVARDERQGAVRTTTLAPVSANLHARGFSRMYRRGGRHGPFWFAYEDVSTTNPWRPIEGNFTRFGDVLPLLTTSDDMYIVMAPGDETTLEFDAAAAPALPKGWTRDFLLYSDGWIKDSDLNTAFGTSVGPLPFHAITQYPYAPGESYPTDAAHQAYLREYNTRTIGRRSDLRASRAP